MSHPTWALGFEDETWWSRTAPPALHAWAPAAHPLRLIEQTVPKDDPDPKALACYGLLVRTSNTPDQTWLRFVDGRPLSAVTIPFLDWCCTQLAAQGKTALLLVWDNASWHLSHAVRDWIHDHNRQVKRAGQGVRLLPCPLPVKSPWLNPIEPKWIHTQRKIVEPARLLTARDLEDRVRRLLVGPGRHQQAIGLVLDHPGHARHARGHNGHLQRQGFEHDVG